MCCCRPSSPTQHIRVQTNVADNWKEQLHRLQSDLAQAQGQLQQQRLLTAQLQAQADVAGASLAEAEGQLRAAQADAAAQTARFRESELAHSAEMLRLQVRLCHTSRLVGHLRLTRRSTHPAVAFCLAADSISCCLGHHLLNLSIYTARTG